MKPTPHLQHQKIIGWKIWYSDRTVDSTQMSWEEAPDDDVQYVMIYFEKKDALGRFTRLASTGCDYYALDGDKFTSSFDNIEEVSGAVKYGKFMDLQELLAMREEFYNDYGEWLEEPKPTVEKEIPGTKGN